MASSLSSSSSWSHFSMKCGADGEEGSGKTMVVVEGRTCESQSHGFKGACLIDSNCALVCKNEGFSGGVCHGFRQRCFCTRNC
ncbi:hypothetical protein OSB04_022631 [Centaurea solstitialis]|uniref:Knottins-like domain-containing protein n=1 Tax=Centaurea solstitialis TaxID=347529 RepID=A0AA38TGC8_9ASTR|nr:hypothetical protein OSB04_022631 [Centaurea solstitialis]